MKRNLQFLLIGLGALALIALVVQIWPRGQRQWVVAGLDRNEAVAFRLGELIREKLPGDGAVAVIQLPAINDAEQEVADRQIKALETGLGNAASPLVRLAPERMPAAERGVLAMKGHALAWGDEFLQWVRTAPRSRVIVSFMGLPADLPPEKLKSLPPILIFGVPGDIPRDEWLTERHVFAWVTPRGNFASAPPVRDTPAEIFNTYFELHQRAGR